MKKLCLLFILLFYLLTILFSIKCLAQDDFNIDKSRAMARQTFIDNFNELNSFTISKSIFVKEMLNNPAKYSSFDKSKITLRQFFIDSLLIKNKKNKDNAFDGYRYRLELHDLNEIYRAVVKEKNINFNEYFNQIANENFNPIFKSARDEAVSAQAATMTTTIRLRSNDICKLQNDEITRTTLKDNISTRHNINQYFVENRNLLAARIENAINEAILEYENQKEIIQSLNPDRSYTNEQIEKEIIQRIKNEQIGKRYPFFDCLKSEIKSIADEKEKQRFLSYINNHKGRLIDHTISNVELEHSIVSKPELHGDKYTSDNFFKDKFTKIIDSLLINGYLTEAHAQNNIPFKHRVTDYYDYNAKYQLKNEIDKIIEQETEEMRKRIADSQYNTYFSEKLDSLELPENEIVKSKNWRSYQKEDSLKLVAVQLITDSRQHFIEEVNKLIEDRLHIAYNDGESAYAGQMDIVKNKKPFVLAMNDFKSAKERGDREEMFRIYNEQVTLGWEFEIMKSEKKQYKHVFDVTRKLIYEYISDELKTDNEKKPIIIRKNEKQSKSDTKTASSDNIKSSSSSGGNDIGLGGPGTGGGLGAGTGPGEGGGGGFRIRYVRKKLEELNDFEEPPPPPKYRLQISYNQQMMSGHSSFTNNFNNGRGLGIHFDYKQTDGFQLCLSSGFSYFPYKQSDGYLLGIPFGIGFTYEFQPLRRIPLYFTPKAIIQNDLNLIKTDLLEQYGVSKSDIYSHYVMGVRPGMQVYYQWRRLDFGLGVDYLVTIFPKSSIKIPIVGKLYRGIIYQYFLSIYF